MRFSCTRTWYHSHFCFKWSFSLCTFIPCMNVMLDYIWMGQVDQSGARRKQQNTKQTFLLTLDFEPTTLKFVVRCCTDWVTRVLMKSVIFKIPLYIHVLPIPILYLCLHWYKFEYDKVERTIVSCICTMLCSLLSNSSKDATLISIECYDMADDKRRTLRTQLGELKDLLTDRIPKENILEYNVPWVERGK